MSAPVDCCSRCGLPILGTPSYVLMECEQTPPKQPELWLCQPCMASLNRWLLHRQRAAKDEVAEQVRTEYSSTGEQANRRRRRTREWHENRLKKRVRSAHVKEAFGILRIVLLIAAVVGLFGAFVAFFMSSGTFARRR